MKSIIRSSVAGLAALFFAVSAGHAQIYLNAGTIETDQPGRQSATRAAVRSGGDLRLIQFDGPIQPEWVAGLEAAGYRIVDFIPDNTYIVFGNATSLQTLRARAAHIKWEGAYLATDKIDAGIHRIAPAVRRARNNGQDLFAIQLMQDAALNAETIALIRSLKDSPLEDISENDALHFVNIKVSLPEEALEIIAAQPDVLSIQAWSAPRMRGERQAQIVADNVNPAGSQPSGPGYYAWLLSKGFTQAQFDSSGFIVDIADDGWDLGNAASPANPEFRKFGTASEATRMKYSQKGTTLASSGSHGKDGHGNINISIVGGFSTNSGAPFVDANDYHRGQGINPFANLGNTKVFEDGGAWGPSSAQEKTFIATNYYKGVRISSDSWGLPGDGLYNVDAQNYDTWTRDSRAGVAGNQEVLYVFAAGNDGPGTKTVGAPGTGKNILSVGAGENYNQFGTDGCNTPNSGADNANDIIDFSSRGPCTDSRIKPDIIAPGTHIAGAASFYPTYTGEGVCDKYQPAGQTNYAASSGTSHSTPAVAGGASLVYQYFINQGWGVPSPAMMKAYLMNSTRYMTGVDANDTLPSNNQGMGRMNLANAFDGAARILRDQLTNNLFTASGQSRTFFGTVSNTGLPLRVTLAWTDAPGATSGNAYKNNLDLEVTVNGTTYKGNVFTKGLSTTGGSADLRNNVESVFLPAGRSGLIEIKVKATNINSDGVPNYGGSLDQDFALVVANATEYTPSNMPPVLNPIGNKSVKTNSLLQFTVSAADAVDGDSVRLWATGIPSWASFSGATNVASASAQFSGTAPATSGSYSVTFLTADKDGTNSESIVIAVSDISCVPAILLSENFDASTSVPTGWVSTSTVNDTDPTHYKSAPNCRSLAVSAALETPAVNNPTQIVFYVDASTKGNGKSATLEYKVGAGAWTSVGSFTANTAGNTYTFDLTSSPDLSEAKDVRFRFASTFNTWYLDDVVIRGMDCAGEIPNSAPTIEVDGGTNQNATVGDELAFTVTAYDDDGDSITLRTNAAPAGATFTTVSGLAPIQSEFRWTPSATGTFSAVFAASDGVLTTTQRVSIAVAAAAIPLDPPVIQAASGVQANQFNANWLASSNATSYELDVSTNSSFAGGGGTTNLFENFSLFVATNGSTDISGSLNTYTLVSGWTGAKIYQDAGVAKIGSASARGFITTPTINLSGNGGNATLTFDLGKYGTDVGAVQIMHAADGSTFQQIDADITPPSNMTPFNIEISGGTASSKIRFYAKGLSKNRFYVDNIVVVQGGGAASYIPGYEHRNVGNVTTLAVTGLSENVTYHYRVKAYNATTNSAYSAVTNVVTKQQSGTPPSINPIAPRSAFLGESLGFQVTATPSEGDPVTLTASNLPSGAVFNSTNAAGSFLWTSASPTGNYLITLRATDKDGFDETLADITVHPLPVVGNLTITNNSEARASFPSIAGRIYRLEYTMNLANSPVLWTVVQTVTGTGSQITLSDTNNVDPLRIYRIVAP